MEINIPKPFEKSQNTSQPTTKDIWHNLLQKKKNSSLRHYTHKQVKERAYLDCAK